MKAKRSNFRYHTQVAPEPELILPAERRPPGSDVSLLGASCFAGMGMAMGMRPAGETIVSLSCRIHPLSCTPHPAMLATVRALALFLQKLRARIPNGPDSAIRHMV